VDQPATLAFDVQTVGFHNEGREESDKVSADSGVSVQPGDIPEKIYQSLGKASAVEFFCGWRQSRVDPKTRWNL
jgi:hypothetical protein